MAVSVASKSIAKRVSQLVGQMTLDEKLAQLGSAWIFELQSKGELDAKKLAAKLEYGVGQITRLAGSSTFPPREAAKAANQIQRFLIEKTRLGIPAIVHEESCSGSMVREGTNFPQMIGLASSFQPELAERMTAVIRRQLRAIGAHQGLAPVLDIARDPRWGRVEETFGEDATLASHFGVAYVRGLQGDSLETGVMATGKHFVGHSLSLGGLNCAPVSMGRHDLWESFLTPFQAAIRDADLATIMCAYPEVDGELVAASSYILTDLLRDALSFEGLLVSDYNAIDMIFSYHNVASSLSEAAQFALKAGIEVELPTSFCYSDPLREVLDAGEVNLELVDRSVERHLVKKFELGLFDNPYVDEGKVVEIFNESDGSKLAGEIAAKSLVLLKNDGLLPLNKKIKRVAVIGPNADSGRNQLGDYSYAAVLDRVSLDPPPGSSFENPNVAEIASLGLVDIVTVLQGVQAVVSPDSKIIYARGCDNLDPDRGGFAEAVAAAEEADAVILVLGDRSGLTPDCTTGETRDSLDLSLPGVQEELARAVIATGKPVAVVLVNGRPLAIPGLDEHANAILEAWLPGEQGGTAVAEALFGLSNPGGKLAATFPRHVGQLPVFYNHKPSGMFSNWHKDYVQGSVAPLYPFGHGLSYTEFDYRDLAIGKKSAACGEHVDISLVVANAGAVEGDEVVQLYVRDLYASSPRPVKELKGYVRVALKPGEARQVTFHLPVDQLAFFDRALNLVLEAGTVEVMVGGSSQDIRLRGEIEIAQDAQIPTRERVFSCPVDVK